MGTFEVEHGGQTYEIEAPDQTSALAAFQKMTGSAAGVAGAPAPAAAAGSTAAPPDPALAARFRSGGSPYGSVDELVHGYTAGLARPAYAAGQAVLGSIPHPFRAPAAPSTFGQRYSQGEQEYDAARQAFSTAHPIGAPMLGVAGGAASLGTGATGVPGVMGRLGQGIRTGGIYGGTQGLAEATGDVGERLQSGATGAGIGAAVGGAVPLAIDAARVGAIPFRNMIQAARNPEGVATRQVAQAMRDDAIDPAIAQARLARARAEGVRDMTIADVAGPNAQRLAAVYGKAPGPGKAQAHEFLAGRAAGQGENVVDIMRPALGHPEGAYSGIDDLIAQRGKAATPLYERARNTPLDTGSPQYAAIMEELQTPTGRQALAAAHRKMLDEKVPSKHIHMNVADDGTVTLTRPPDTRTLDYVKRSIDDKIQAARRGGNMDDARILGGIKNNIVNNLDDLNPAYRQARAVFRGPTESKEAIEAGMQFLTMPHEEIRKTMAGLSQVDRDFARMGMARALQTVAGRPGDQTANLLSGNMRARFQAAFPDQASYERAQRGLQHIREQANVSRKVRGGSETYENFATAGDAQIDPGVLMNAARGNLLGLTADALRGLTNRFGGITPGVSRAGTSMLLTPDQARQQAVFDAIRQASLRQGVTPGNLAALQHGVIGGIMTQAGRMLFPPPQD